MGLTSTEIHNLTDKVAAMLALEMAGLDTLVTGSTVNSVRKLLEDVVDATAEDALGSYATTVDRFALGGVSGNRYSALLPILNRSPYQEFISALDGYVRSANGGANTSLDSALTAASATLHPLFAEACRQGRLQTSFTAANIFAPNYLMRAAQRVYQGADGSLSEETTDAGSATSADVTLFASDDDCLYIGDRNKFTHISVALSTVASADITATVKYWNGAAWVAVSGLSDQTVGFTKNGRITWTAPSDWAPGYLQGDGATAFADKTPLYYLRISRTANTLVTPPTGTCIQIAPSPLYISGTTQLGVNQGPLAICRITGVNTISVESLLAVDYARWKAPAIRFKWLGQAPGASLTPTISYTNQDGNNVTQAQGSWTPGAALATQAVTLNGADTGVRAILTSSWAVTTTLTEGCFAVEVTESRVPAL